MTDMLISFSGTPGEDLIRFICSLKRYSNEKNITAKSKDDQSRAFTVLESCLCGSAWTWYNAEIKGKNWKLQNVLDRTRVNTLSEMQMLHTNHQCNFMKPNPKYSDHKYFHSTYIPSGV